ncbi:MAG: Rid family hydrolase [FCB group bacterium]|jgi:enamine deaminase RidA (YjgF/YER057c/UK114 family)|nr:Rid family hydrolase [FCB group bacterium]
MESRRIDCGSAPVSAHASCFRGASGVNEFHLILEPRDEGDFEEQLAWLERAYVITLETLGISLHGAVFRRFFCGDVLNQTEALKARAFSNPRRSGEPCAVSWIGQAPLPPAKVALWAYHVSDPAGAIEKVFDGSTLTVSRGELSHHWSTGLCAALNDTPHAQTQAILEQYDGYLGEKKMILAENLIRTWFFVRDVDENYGGLVAARREFFARRGLTPETHFVASTGIEGVPAEAGALVSLDAYAVGGVRDEQVEYLSALGHLSHTHVYGVTFERGTSVAYRDRKHVILSGTASIDCKGEIVHPGDVARQLERTLENMAALLATAGATLDDMCHFLVYVREPEDRAEVWRCMRERFEATPMVVVVGPVCRPGWLVEIEGMAVVDTCEEGLPVF